MNNARALSRNTAIHFISIITVFLRSWLSGAAHEKGWGLNPKRPGKEALVIAKWLYRNPVKEKKDNSH